MANFLRGAGWRAAIALALAATPLAAQENPDFAAEESDALAQPATAVAEPALPAAERCELHVWPSGKLRSTYYGWFHGGIVDGAVTGRDGYPEVPSEPLGTADQLRLLGAADLPALLELPGYVTIVHETALDSRTIRATRGPIAANPPACYAEFVVDDVFFQQDVFTGSYLKTLFRFRLFDGGEQVDRFGTYTKVSLGQFPPETPEEADVALAELDAAYRRSLVEFGIALNAPSKIRRSR